MAKPSQPCESGTGWLAMGHSYANTELSSNSTELQILKQTEFNSLIKIITFPMSVVLSPFSISVLLRFTGQHHHMMLKQRTTAASFYVRLSLQLLREGFLKENS